MQQTFRILSNPLIPRNGVTVFLRSFWIRLVHFHDELIKIKGDKEKALGLPISPYFDRENTDQAKLTINFVDYIVSPLYSSLIKLFPSLSFLSDWIAKNKYYTS
jgi:hypothetical protein